MARDLHAEAVRRLIVALDVPSVQEAERLIERLSGRAGIFKIGLELLFAGGIELARHLAQRAQVFLDAKLHDIPNTVERATRRIAELGVTFLTVHAQDRASMEAAVRGRGSAGTKLLGVTVLTHLGEADLAAIGNAVQLAELAAARARLAHEAGFDGIVCSPHEVARIRRETAPDFLIVTPGIRPRGAERADQTRSTSPGDAIRGGADFLVVGRPITQADDPARAADAIVAEIVEALAAGN